MKLQDLFESSYVDISLKKFVELSSDPSIEEIQLRDEIYTRREKQLYTKLTGLKTEVDEWESKSHFMWIYKLHGVPYLIRWDRNVKNPRGTSAHIIDVLDQKLKACADLGVEKLNKHNIVKAALLNYKDCDTLSAKTFIATARKLGYDYPEFKAIEKSFEQ